MKCIDLLLAVVDTEFAGLCVNACIHAVFISTLYCVHYLCFLLLLICESVFLRIPTVSGYRC